MSTTLMLIWDYDTPTGFDVSYQSREADPMSDYRATDLILELLAAHEIVSTFACVGIAAQPGPLPYHNPGQIRTIHAEGHEIASHSQCHELVPALSNEQLLETCRTSKESLEDCIGAEVIGFVPPWNRPFHYPQKLSFSSHDFRDGGGWWKQSIPSLCSILADCGYRWVRIRYAPFYEQLLRKIRPNRKNAIQPAEIGQCRGIITLRLSCLGYDQTLTDWLEYHAYQNNLLVIYAHPHGIDHPNSQNWQHLKHFAAWYSSKKEIYNLTFTTPGKWLEQYG